MRFASHAQVAGGAAGTTVQSSSFTSFALSPDNSKNSDVVSLVALPRCAGCSHVRVCLMRRVCLHSWCAEASRPVFVCGLRRRLHRASHAGILSHLFAVGLHVNMAASSWILRVCSLFCSI